MNNSIMTLILCIIEIIGVFAFHLIMKLEGKKIRANSPKLEEIEKLINSALKSSDTIINDVAPGSDISKIANSLEQVISLAQSKAVISATDNLDKDVNKTPLG